MIELSIDATSFAHSIHYAVLGVGLVGLFVLLGPQLVGGRRASSVDDEHALRVLALTEQIASGGLGVRVAPPIPAPHVGREVADPVRACHLPIVVVSSAAAAGVHAAVAPAHFRELLVFGLFFAGVALAQVGWALAVVVQPSRSLLLAGVVGNSAILLLWLVTRTVGLPGLLLGPEEVGAWDVCSGIWEVAVVLVAGRILLAEPADGLRLPAWQDWMPSARTWTFGSALALPVLALVGAGA